MMAFDIAELRAETVPHLFLTTNVAIGMQIVALLGADVDAFRRYTSEVTDMAAYRLDDDRRVALGDVADLLNDLRLKHGPQARAIAASFLISILIDMEKPVDERRVMTQALLGWSQSEMPP